MRLSPPALLIALSLLGGVEALASSTAVERHAQVLRSGEVERFHTRQAFSAKSTVYAKVSIDGREAAYEVSGRDVQFRSHGVLVLVLGSDRAAPIRVRMANLRAGTVRVVCEFRW